MYFFDLAAIPVHHDDGWSLIRYVGDGPLTFIVDDGGDHEEIDLCDVPATDAQNAAWVAYYEFVIVYGEDPLGEFFVVKENETYIRDFGLTFREPMNGDNLSLLSRVGEDIHGHGDYGQPQIPDHNLPDCIVSYFDLVEGRSRNHYAYEDSIAELIRLCYLDDNVKVRGATNRSFTITVKLEDTRPNPDYATQLQTAARKALG